MSITAALAKLIFRTRRGIMYPSVEIPGGVNLAIPAKLFAGRFEVLWTDIVEVGRYLGCGVYIPPASVRYSEEFGDNGDISWKSSRKLLETLSFNFKAGFSLEKPVRARVSGMFRSFPPCREFADASRPSARECPSLQGA
jgi:hypothetical protein